MTKAPTRIEPVSVADLADIRAAGTLDDGARQLLEAERAYVDAFRRRQGLPPDEDRGLSALCISGGGIRSATFALGVLQALAAADVLKRFDYLSTVSGGGYIGSSLTWLLSKAAKEDGDPPLDVGLGPNSFPYGSEDPAPTVDSRTPHRDGAHQIKLLSYLRGHGRYLTPGEGIGLTSLITVALRGAFLSVLVTVPLAAAVFAAVLTVSLELTGDPEAGFAFFRHVGLGLIGLLAAATIVYALGTFLHAPQGETREKYRFRRLYDTYAGATIAIAVAVTAVGFVPDVHIHVGLGALLLGAIKSAILFAFANRETFPVPVRPVAVAGCVLVLYGVLVVAHRLALWGLDTVIGGEGWERWAPVALVGLALIVGRFVNLNYVSMHRYYRDRLMESFMPDVATALENATGPALSANEALLSEMNRVEDPAGPYHVINTNVNLVGARSTVRRARGGDSFILSPMYCGSSETGWRRTDEFLRGGLTLATAMAVSGAAAEPNAGVAGRGMTREPSVAALMTLLNLTLGFWIQHPLRSQRPTAYPNHLNPGLYSMIPAAYALHRTFLELGDGGHFENLGLYEMIRRRARFIVVSDAGADPNYRFHDLLNALRKIEADFGARISFAEGDRPADFRSSIASTAGSFASTADSFASTAGSFTSTADSHAAPDAGSRRLGHVTGRIEYADGSTGRLVLIKACLVAGLDLQITAFRDDHPTFPHETTANQEFDEEHVDAYRRLGYELTCRMIEDVGVESL